MINHHHRSVLLLFEKRSYLYLNVKPGLKVRELDIVNIINVNTTGEAEGEKRNRKAKTEILWNRTQSSETGDL